MKQSGHDITIRITSGTILKTVLILAVCYFVYQFRDLVLVILTAVVLASAVEPFAGWFVKRKVPRVIGVLIVYLSVITVFVGILYIFIPPVVDDIVNINSSYDLSNLLPGVDSVSSGALSGSGFSLSALLADLQKSFSGNPEDTLQMVSKIFGGVLSFILILVFSFYLAVQKHGVSNFLRIVTPDKQEKYVIDLWKRTQHKIGLWMQGQLLLGLIMGVLVFLGLSLMQMPFVFLLSIVAMLFEIIPIFGPVLAAIPAVLLGYTHGVSFIGTVGPGLTSAVVVTFFYVIIQQFENHLIYPLVVRKVVGVPPLLVIIAIVIGIESVGFLGVILAVPIAAAIMEFVDDVQKDKDLAKEAS